MPLVMQKNLSKSVSVRTAKNKPGENSSIGVKPYSDKLSAQAPRRRILRQITTKRELDVHKILSDKGRFM